MMIKCPECGNDISEYSTQCTHCGCPNSKYFSNDDDLIFENRDEGLFIAGYSGDSINIVIPESYEGKKIIGIGKNAFADKAISSVKLLEGLKYIEDEAFICCSGLSTVFFPKSLISIGKRAFYKCRLKEIKLFEGIQEIGDESFGLCASLNKIEIPMSIINIGAHAFKYTAWLIGQQKLNPLVAISNILIDGTNAKGTVRLPSNVSKIAPSAFYSNPYIKNVVIPSNVKEIGAMAFADCVNLKTVDMEEGVETIGRCAFIGARSLSIVNIPNSVLYIGGAAFLRIDDLSVYCARSSKAVEWASNWVDWRTLVTWNSKFPISSFPFL